MSRTLTLFLPSTLITISKLMAILVDTTAVEGIDWSAILGRYPLEKSYLSILAAYVSTPDMGMKEAAKDGHMDIVKYFISKGAHDWSERSSNPTSSTSKGCKVGALLLP